MNNTTLLFVSYIVSILYISIDIFIILKKDLLNRDLLFTLFATYILNISMSLFYFYFNNLTYSLINSLFLMTLSFMLLLELKRTLKRYPILSFPYFLFTIFLFSNIVNNFILLSH